MQFRILLPNEALRPYICRYVYVRADGSTDTMMPPTDDPRFVNGKHVQPLLPNYGSFVFMRDVRVDVSGVAADGLTLLGANQTTIGLTTLSGWFNGMLLDFEPGGLHALMHIDLQDLAGKVLTAQAYGDPGLLQLDSLFKSTQETLVRVCDVDFSVFCFGFLVPGAGSTVIVVGTVGSRVLNIVSF